MEIRAYLSYKRKRHELSYWRSTHGHEVDYLIGTETAVEVKSSGKVSNRDFKGLRFLEEGKVFQKYVLVSQDPVQTRNGRFHALYWVNFLKDLWLDNLC